MCGFIHTLPTLWGCAFRRLRRLLRTNAYAAMHKMACFESAAIVSECEKTTQGGRTVCYWYTKYPPGSLSASTVGGRRVCSQLPSHSVCGHSTIVAWCVRVIQQSSSSSLQTTIVGPTKVAWCVPSFKLPADFKLSNTQKLSRKPSRRATVELYEPATRRNGDHLNGDTCGHG